MSDPLANEIVRYYQREVERSAAEAQRLMQQIRWMDDEIARLRAIILLARGVLND